MLPGTRRWADAAPLIVAAIGALLLVMLRGAVPFPLVSDHAYFLPASWWMAETGHLANPWMQPGFDVSLKWHGFAQPWLVGAFARLLGGGWSGVYLSVNLLAAATILGTALLGRALGLSAWRGSAVVLVSIALMLDARSRPEILSTLETGVLVWLCAGAVWRFPGALWRGAGIGAISAAIVCTHPAAAVLACFGVIAYLGVRGLRDRPSPTALAGLVAAMAGGFALALAGLFAVAFPDGPVVWLRGIAEAGRITMARTDTEGLLRYFLANRFLPGFGLLALPILTRVWAASLPEPNGRLYRPRLILALAIGAAGLYLLHRLALRIPATYYNVTAVLVALCLTAAVVAPRSWRWGVDAALLAFGFGALAGIGVWCAQALADWPTVASSRTELAAAIAADRAAGRTVCADAAALAALDDVALARSVGVSLRLAEAPNAPDPATCDVYYQLQAVGGSSSTPVAGFVATETTARPNLFTHVGMRPSHFGFTRWETPKMSGKTALPAASPGDEGVRT